MVKEIQGEKGVEKLLLESVKDGSTSEFPVDGIFIFIGTAPTRKCSATNWSWTIRVTSSLTNACAPNIPGVFAAGEVCDPFFRQVITSAGMGAAAAISATRLLESESE